MKKQHVGRSLILLLAVALFYIACQKNGGGNPPVIEPVTPITASLTGRVTDNNRLPVSGATVKAGTAIATTDLNGYFRFKGITIKDPDVAYIKVDKEGFFTGSRTYQSTTGSNGYVAIQLIKKIAAGSFSAALGGTVTVPDNGGKIDFPVNGMVNANSNAAYSGPVSVSAFFINPVANDFQEMMPGTLRGINTSDQQVGLQSYGMMAIELTGAGNEKLQLSAGKTATLTFPIPSGLQAQAPTTIPLWSFNDSTGLWKQEGTASRQGNNYVGVVGHFSFWNCDFPLPIFNFKGTIVNQNGIPLSYVKVSIKVLDDAISSSGSGFTDSLGLITGTLPANKNLQLTIVNKCGETLFTKNIGPFSATASLGNIVVNTTAAAIIRFTGTVTNCTGAAVTSGFVDILIDNNHYLGSVLNGNFSLVVSPCKAISTVSITAFDDANLVQGTAIQVAVTDTIVATGTLTACGSSISEYLNYKLSGASNIFASPADSIIMGKQQNGDYSIWFDRKSYRNPSDNANLIFAPPSTGTSALKSVSIYNNNYHYRLKSPVTINITENGAIGAYITGNLTADLTRDSASGTYPLTANFRIKRSF